MVGSTVLHKIYYAYLKNEWFLQVNIKEGESKHQQDDLEGEKVSEVFVVCHFFFFWYVARQLWLDYCLLLPFQYSIMRFRWSFEGKEDGDLFLLVREKIFEI